MIVGCLFSWFVISLVREVPQFAVSAYLVHVLPGRTRISPIPAALSPLSRFFVSCSFLDIISCSLAHLSGHLFSLSPLSPFLVRPAAFSSNPSRRSLRFSIFSYRVPWCLGCPSTSSFHSLSISLCLSLLILLLILAPSPHVIVSTIYLSFFPFAHFSLLPPPWLEWKIITVIGEILHDFGQLCNNCLVIQEAPTGDST